MGNKRKWKKPSSRTFEVSQDGLYMAIIFGSTLPRQMWGWAVWGHKFCKEGVSFSLKSARNYANAAIDELLSGVEAR